MKLSKIGHHPESHSPRGTERRRNEEEAVTRHNDPVATNDKQRISLSEEPPWNGEQTQLLDGNQTVQKKYLFENILSCLFFREAASRRLRYSRSGVNGPLLYSIF